MAFVDLDNLKDDLGITGSADDGWLARRIAGVLAAFTNYAHRYIGPLATFEDDFTRIYDRRGLWISPPYNSAMYSGMRIAPYLVNTPITGIVSATNNGATVATGNILYDPGSGELFSIAGAPAVDVGRLLAGAIKVTYTAGWAELPSDLYEALVGIVRNQYQLRAAAAAGDTVGGLGVKSITVPDVGSVTLGGAGTAFETAASIMRRSGGGGGSSGGGTGGGAGSARQDPYLGPWHTALDAYFRPVIGDSLFPASRLVSTP